MSVANSSVNVHDTNIIGTTIIKKMVRQSAFGYSYKKKDIVVNMSRKTVEYEDEQTSIDNQFLF